MKYLETLSKKELGIPKVLKQLLLLKVHFLICSYGHNLFKKQETTVKDTHHLLKIEMGTQGSSPSRWSKHLFLKHFKIVLRRWKQGKLKDYLGVE